MGNFLLQGHAFWTKERRDNILKGDGDTIPRYDAQGDRSICGRHDSKVPRRR